MIYLLFVTLVTLIIKTMSRVYEDRVTLGLVVPFIDLQIERLKHSLDLWTTTSSLACHNSHLIRKLPIQVYFYHPGNHSVHEQKIIKWWNEMEIRGCLLNQSATFLCANLPDRIANTHPDGPCAQFYSLFELLRGEVNYIFIMEPDVVPIQPFWLPALYHQVAPNRDDFWIKGSVSFSNVNYGQIEKRMDYHFL